MEGVFLSLAAGTTTQQPRLRVRSSPHVLHNLGALSPALGVASLKSYLSGPGGVRFVTLLFELESSQLLAVIESNRLGQLRTGCATALACRYLGPRPCRRLALLGSGSVARGQLEALVSEVEPDEIGLWSRNLEKREAMGAWARETMGLSLELCDSAREAVTGADLVVTATSSSQPVLEGSALGPQGLLCAVGSNWAQRREVDDEAVGRCGLWVVDSRDQALLEAGDLLMTPGFSWEGVRELAPVVAGGRLQGGPSWVGFKSLGLGCEDLAAAKMAYSKALAAGLGQRWGQVL